jgi:MYXO-CTERM domain-containing protein
MEVLLKEQDVLMKRFVWWCLSAVLLLSSTGQVQAHTKVFIPFQIEEALPRDPAQKEYKNLAGVRRRKAPVTITLALPGDFDMPLYGPKQFTLITLDPTVKVGPIQMRILSRWTFNKVIQYLQIDTSVDVDANKANTALVLVIGETKDFPSMGKDKGDSFEINTGKATFTIRKKAFNLLDKVVVGDKTLVNSGASPGLVLTGQDGTEYFASRDKNIKVEMEENGPIKTVIAAHGTFFSAADKRNLDFTVRMHFYKDKTRVRTFVTLRNASKQQLENVLYRSLELRIKTALGSGNWLFRTHDGEKTGKLASTDKLRLLQGENNTATFWDKTFDKKHWPSGIQGYNLTNGTVSVAKGTREQPIRLFYAQLKGAGDAHVTFGTRFAAQWWPQSLGIDGDGTIRHGVFPAGNDKPYIIRFGTHATREVMWHFDKEDSTPRDDFFRFQYPLVSKPQDPGWFNQVEIAWMRVSSFLEEQDYNLNLQYPVNKTPWDTINRRPEFIVPRFLDWSLIRPTRYYDPAKIALVNYHRQEKNFGTGYYLFAHQRGQLYADQGVYHSDDFDLSKLATDVPALLDPKTGLPKPATTLPNGDKLPPLSPHFTRKQHHAHFLRSLYWQTGETRLYNTYIDWGEWLLKDAGKGSSLSGHAWDLYHLTDLYRLTDNDIYKKKAAQLFEDHFAKALGKDSATGQNKQRGFLLGPDSKKTALSILEQGAIVPRALMYYHEYATRSSSKERNPDTLLGDRVRDVVAGMVRFVVQETWSSGGDKPGDFGNPATFNADTPVDNPRSGKEWNSGIQGIYLSYFFGYLLSGDKEYLTKGKLLLKTTAFNTPSVYWYQDLPGRQNLQYLIDYPILFVRWRPLPLKVTKVGNEMVLKWIVPYDCRVLWLKTSDKLIVPSLGYDPKTGKYSKDPATHIPFFAATNLKQRVKPGEAKKLQTLRIPIPAGQKTMNFAARYLSIDPRDPDDPNEFVPEGTDSDGGEPADSEPTTADKKTGDAGNADAGNKDGDAPPDKGCSGCQTTDSTLGWWFGLLVLLGFFVRRRKQ